MGWQEELRAKRAETERWIRQREAELRGAASLAEARGRQVYANAIKTGQQVLARTPAEVRRLGVAAVQGRLPQALGATAVKQAMGEGPIASASTRRSGPAQVRPTATSRPSRKVDARRELDAGVSGFVDEASLGLADNVLAASNAVGEAVRDRSVADLAGDYRASMAEKRARDAYDDKHHGLARNTGRVLGFASTVAAMGAPGAARALLVAAPKGRAAMQAARLGLRYGPDPRGLTRMAAYGGAAAGLIDQAATDVVTGHTSTPLESVAAAAGGALGGIATRVAGPNVGGAVGGAATSALTDLARGDVVSGLDALEAAHAGAIFGKLGGVWGEDYLRTLPTETKGKIGEFLTSAKARARGDEILDQQRGVHLISRGRRPEMTIADTISADRRNPMKLNESKMGPNAVLNSRQLEARNQFGDAYVVDYWRFRDGGKAGGAAMSPFGAYITDEREPRAFRP
jgi:hypothetical protein